LRIGGYAPVEAAGEKICSDVRETRKGERMKGWFSFVFAFTVLLSSFSLGFQAESIGLNFWFFRAHFLGFFWGGDGVYKIFFDFNASIKAKIN